MKILLSLFLTLGVLFPSFGQILNPVSWSYSAEHVEGDQYDLVFKAKIDRGWAIYSQYIDEGGPIPTEFVFEEGSGFERIGKVEESDNAKKSQDEIFQMELIKFYKEATFTQRVKLTDPSKPIKGYLEFMTCDDERCLPPKDIEFAFDFDGGSAGGGASTEQGAEANDVADGHPGIPSVTLPNGDQGDDASGIFEPVTWSFSQKKNDDGSYDLIVKGQIDDGWAVYTQHIVEDGPIPTTFYFDEKDGLSLVGETAEDGPQRYEGFDPVFQMNVVKFKHEVIFTQNVKVTDEVGVVSGEFEFMTCDDERCLPPTYVSFEFVVNAKAADAIAAGGAKVSDDNVIDQGVAALQSSYKEPVGSCSDEEEEKDDSLIWTFVLGFAGGLLALLTPCVFPMIPLTVSFFSKDTKRKGWMNGLIYGLSIIVIYVLLGFLITMAFGAEALNELSTNWIANTLFFVIFIAFAFSFFGYYEIQLPASWTNKSDKMADKGGLIGTFFMAFTLALVSFSCTGPIIGSALVQSAANPVGPLVVMLGFSTALALPFGLFAAFPAWLNSLPQSGGWMNSVKVILGFLEVALAFKFLSVADMTSHWGFLKYEVFMGIWVTVAVAMALYLFGLIRFPHDSKTKKMSVTRIALGSGMAVLAIYLASGFMMNERTQSYNSLPMMSGLAPPANYNFFIKPQEPDAAIKAKYASYSKCANNLDCFKDYSEGVAYAKEVNKPVFLDFTGYGCVNCRKTEEHIWVKDQIWPKLKGEFVMISLYVDDRKPLDDVLISKSTNEKLRNVGNKWADFQIVNFQQNSQPLYVIISPDEQVLATPRGYQEGVQDYADFLDCGLNTFKQLDAQIGMK
jgi:thiol:disulfide interchange protein DsbD